MTAHTLPRHLVASPGEILEEWLDERGMTQRELAERLGMSQKFVSQLVNGKASLTADTAQGLSLVTRVSAGTWLRIEADYQATVKRAELVDVAAESPVEAELVAMLRDAGVVTAPARARGEQTIEVWEFLGVGSHQGVESLSRRHAAAFRTSGAFAPDPVATEVLMSLARREAELVPTGPLDRDALIAALPQLQSLMPRGATDGAEAARDVLAPVGVALVLLPDVPKVPCNGVTLWTRTGAVVALTSSGRREDTFWFTLFHELSHVLDGERDAIYLDAPARSGDRPEAEVRADAFAAQVLGLELVPDHHRASGAA